MGPEQGDINPLDEAFERAGPGGTETVGGVRRVSRRGARYFRHCELLLAQIYAGKDLQTCGRRGGFGGKYRHRKLDRLADAASVQAPCIFLAIYADFQRELRFLIHPATCIGSAG